jgi:hypothetical protein
MISLRLSHLNAHFGAVGIDELEQRATAACARTPPALHRHCHMHNTARTHSHTPARSITLQKSALADSMPTSFSA